jgi:heme/copper-type cytochrome/quinol oxidase subunit 1
LRLKQSAYHLLLLTGLLLVVTSFLLNQNRTIDIHVHDTYYVITQGHFFIFLAIIVWVLWILYMVTNKVLYSKSLTWVHVIITLVTLLFLLFFLNNGGDIFNPKPRRYLDYSNFTTFNRYERDTRWITYITIALLFGQVTFFVNLIVGIVKRVT